MDYILEYLNTFSCLFGYSYYGIDVYIKIVKGVVAVFIGNNSMSNSIYIYYGYLGISYGVYPVISLVDESIGSATCPEMIPVVSGGR